MDSKPAGITANRNTNVLVVRWKDGHESKYPFWLLRSACPCAECQGGYDKMSGRPPEESPETKLENLRPVGTYGLSFHWADGHSAGIFNWDYLHSLCPCPKCRAD